MLQRVPQDIILTRATPRLYDFKKLRPLPNASLSTLPTEAFLGHNRHFYRQLSRRPWPYTTGRIRYTSLSAHKRHEPLASKPFPVPPISSQTGLPI
jgi:hypothetical protein